MKIQFRSDRGSVFVVILVITGIMGVTLASYLHMVSNQNVSIMRSMAWNEAVAVSEAGIEEAMAHLNRNRTNRARDNWTLTGNYVIKEKNFGDQKYKTYIEAYEDRPTIVSEGWTKNPQTGEFLPNARTVRVTTTNDAIFAKGMVAKGRIDLSGNGVLSDSFDSSNTNKSTNGKYDASKRGDKGDVATNSSIVDSSTDPLNVWNAEIYGKASTGPGGNIGIKNGTVGSLAHHASGATGIESGWSTDDMNVYFPDVFHPGTGARNIYGALPSVSADFPPALIVVDGTSVNFNYTVPNGYYHFRNGLNLNNLKMYIRGPTVFLIEGGDFSISGQGGITIGTNANLQIYMNSYQTSIGGNGIVNTTGLAANFSYWGMPNNKKITVQGNGDFTGTIYAPQADLKMGGGGSSGDDFMGALVTGSVTLGGHYKFHYDESLGVFGPRRGYTIVTWNEIAWAGP